MTYDVDNIFTYHAPKPGQNEIYTGLRSVAKGLALHLLHVCPESRERSLALANLEQAVFWANASIGRHE